MFKKYVLLDVKNPNTKGRSICAIAVIVVEKNIVIEQKCTLINPEDDFDNVNTEIIGIDKERFEKAPVLCEYWTGIKGILEENIIVGHNITYKLAVLSGALERYNIEVPKFRYVCTLELAGKYIKTDSYRLENICRDIGYMYDFHVVFEEAIAARKVFQYMRKQYDILLDSVQTFNYRENLNNKQKEFPIGHLFYLCGLVQGILADGEVTEKEMACLNKWVENNLCYKRYGMFNNIIQTLTTILEDRQIDQYHRLRLRALVNRFTAFSAYCITAQGFQIINGLSEGITAKGKFTCVHVEKLKSLLQNYEYLSGLYPYDKFVRIVDEIANSENSDDENREALLEVIDEMKNSDSAHNQLENVFPLENRTFCLTGEFTIASEKFIRRKLKEKGAIEKRGVSMKLDYLFVGGMSSGEWKVGNFGSMITRAIELQEKGAKLLIIAEEELEGLLL